MTATAARPGRSIEAAAIAGIAHAVLFMAARALLLRAPDPRDATVTEWYANAGNQRTMVTALNLVVMSSIAFLWFVAVIRRRVGLREDRFFGTVFLGSALLISALWMLAAVIFVTPALGAYFFSSVQTAQTVAPWQAAGLGLATIVGIRIQAVFIISASTVARLSGAFPRALVALGYLIGLTLLVAPVPSEVLAWSFPAWVAVMSATLLIRRHEFDPLPDETPSQAV